jgi:uncharacterized membrane protein YphA (DoxX/SURF4 family)
MAMAFLYHGSAILFGAFGGPGPRQFAVSHNYPIPVGLLVGLAQVAGGLAVLAGVFARLGASCVAVVMVGAFLPSERFSRRIGKALVEGLQLRSISMQTRTASTSTLFPYQPPLSTLMLLRSVGCSRV